MKSKTISIILAILLLPTLAFSQVNSVSVVKDPVFGTNNYVLLLSIATLYSDKIQYQRIYEAPHYLSDKLPENFKVENPFILEWKTTQEYTKYNLYRVKPIYQIDIRHKDCGIFGCSQDDALTWIRNNCQDIDGDGSITYIMDKNLVGRVLDIYCAGKGAKIGDLYSLSSPSPYWKAQFKLSNGKDTETFYLGTDEGYTKRIDNKAFIRFSGLTLFSYPKNPNNVLAFISTDGTKTLIDSSYLSTANSLYRDDAYQYVNDVADGKISEIQQESNLNNRLVQAKYSWTSNGDFPKNKVEFTSTNLILHSDERVSIQNFNVYLNGNWIGIIIPQGKPKIVDIKAPEEITATQTEEVKVYVKNVGDGEGTFEVRLTCNPPITVYQPVIYTQQEPGETKEITFNIGSIQQSSKQVVSCKAEAKDTTSGYSDKEGMTITLKPMAECEDGQKQVVLIQGTYRVLECENGQFSKIILACGINEYPKSDIFGNYECVPITEQSQPQEQTQQSALSQITGAFLRATGIGINIVASIIAGLLVFFLTRNMQGKDIELNKTKLIALLLVVLISGIITYYYWWVVLLILGIVIIVKTFI